jgi:hypothetical protein
VGDRRVRQSSRRREVEPAGIRAIGQDDSDSRRKSRIRASVDQGLEIAAASRYQNAECKPFHV